MFEGVVIDDGFWDKVKASLQKGYALGNDGKIRKKDIRKAIDSPWIFFNTAPHSFCRKWLYLYFFDFGLIPKFCGCKCHKVVAKPNTVAELFEVEKLGRALGYPGKCGINLRDYVFGPYGAYWYCESIEQAQELYEELSGHGIKDVFIKRMCTEMERKCPTNSYIYTEEDELLESRLDAIYEIDSESTHQSDFEKNYVRNKWLKHAYMIGDETYRDITGFDTGVESTHYETKVSGAQDRADKSLQLTL